MKLIISAHTVIFETKTVYLKIILIETKFWSEKARKKNGIRDID